MVEREVRDKFGETQFFGGVGQPLELGGKGGGKRQPMTPVQRVENKRDGTIHRVGLDGNTSQPALKPLIISEKGTQQNVNWLTRLTGWRPPTIENEEIDE